VIARAQRRCPVVLTLTGAEALQSWQAPLSFVTARVVDAVVVRSEEMRRRLRLPGAAVIPAGVDLDVFRPRPREDARRRLGLPTSRKIVLFVGERRPEKRLELIEAAVARLAADDGDVRLMTVCGKPQEEVAWYLNAADVLALASRNEGSPGAVKEAMACNVPVVSTDVGDVREVIAGTDGCFLASPDVDDFARRLNDALAHGGPTEGRRAVERLAWPAVTRRLVGVYESVAARRA
jgi:teichuronic acid biosynthesis glycosyltransferase TuaC